MPQSSRPFDGALWRKLNAEPLHLLEKETPVPQSSWPDRVVVFQQVKREWRVIFCCWRALDEGRLQAMEEVLTEAERRVARGEFVN